MTRSRITLRRSLVLGIVALLAAVTALIGVVSVLSLQGFLVGRLDGQLFSAGLRSQSAVEGRPGDPGGANRRPPASEFLALPAQREGTLAALTKSGSIYNAAILSANGKPVSVAESELAALGRIPADSVPRTVDLGPGVGPYRVIVKPTSGEYSLLVGLPLGDVQATVLQLAALIAGIGVLAIGGAAIGGALVVRLALRPLERVAAAATRVAELPLDRGEVALAVRVSADDADPATEVGKVGAALNRMLEHVASALTARQASENKVRAFVADASHELRTPLASIRGYAELTRRGGHDLPDDVAHALGRVESESVRMTALVEDLLLLARLDEGRAFGGDPVDLSRLLIDSVSDARVAGPDHVWELDLPDESVLARVDDSRLHQVVMNLLANARTHTPPGTVVTTALRRTADEAIIEVRDTGPGIDDELAPKVFERFVRGDSSRSRASGSTGLGLAIVAAVVEAHGGRAEVESKPGMTVFRVILPLGEIA
jgi:two-component system OmpR family sensor kinase